MIGPKTITVIHSSDLHIDGRASDAFHPLCKVLDVARRESADLVLLAGLAFLEDLAREANF